VRAIWIAIIGGLRATDAIAPQQGEIALFIIPAAILVASAYRGLEAFERKRKGKSIGVADCLRTPKYASGFRAALGVGEELAS
jgi:hypothetical protein